MAQRNFDLTFGLISSIALVSSIAPAGRLKIGVNLSSVLVKSAAALFLLLLALIYARRDPRIARVARVAFWAVVFTNVFEFPIYFMFRLKMVFGDMSLAAADRWMGLGVPRILHLTARFPIFAIILGYTYNSLIFLIIIALLLPTVMGRTDKSDEFLLGIALSVGLTLIILSFIQAIGPWVSHAQMKPTDIELHAAAVLHSLKSWTPLTFDLGYPEPIVALPSWHAIFAVLSCVALSRVAILRRIAVVWAILVLISCITTGWHYTIDVLAGVATALLAASGARALSLWLGKETL